jgi:hypothetical protein
MKQLTFKYLKKRFGNITQLQEQQNRIFEVLHNKPFWIWNIEEHKQEDIITNGDCCFNHIIGLPQKNGVNKPMYDYERMIFDSLVSSQSPYPSLCDTQDGTASSNKHKICFIQHI